jgi:hypothetical protein
MGFLFTFATMPNAALTRKLSALVVAVLAALFHGSAAAQKPPPIAIQVVSEKEVVFESKRQGCAQFDLPDTPLHAFRRSDGQIVGFATHHVNRRFFISATGEFRRDCEAVFRGDHDPDPAAYNDRIWILAPWTLDGQNIVALGHNEYQGEKHPGRCAYKKYNECWYNSIVLLQSRDGGRSFQKMPGTLPIATATFRYEDHQGQPRGFFGPTNMVEHAGRFHTVIFTTGGEGQKRGNCLFRSSRPADDAAWEYWTSEGFRPSRRDPYKATESSLPCEPLWGLGGRVWSIARHKASGMYLATVGMQPADAATGMIGISTSEDLIRWSRPIPLFSVPLIWSRNCADKVRYGYPALLDLSSEDRMFSDVGDEPHIYMTELHFEKCGGTFDRNLIRYRLRITRSG